MPNPAKKKGSRGEIWDGFFPRREPHRPNEHTIWNKLGATLANSGHPRDALLAYHQALQIKPNFTRAWSNLAIAHTVLNEGADAARFYLTALRISPQATHLWRTPLLL